MKWDIRGVILDWFDIVKAFKGITFPARLFSEDEIVEVWNESNSDNPRPPRRTNPAGLNPFTFDGDYITAWDNNRIIGYSGFEDHGTWWALSGARVHPDYANGGSKGFTGIGSRLQKAKMSKMGRKAGIGLLNNKSLGGNNWADSFSRKFWDINPEDVEKYYEHIPKKVVDFHKTSAEEKGSQWVIYIPTSMAQAWNQVEGER